MSPFRVFIKGGWFPSPSFSHSSHLPPSVLGMLRWSISSLCVISHFIQSPSHPHIRATLYAYFGACSNLSCVWPHDAHQWIAVNKCKGHIWSFESYIYFPALDRLSSNFPKMSGVFKYLLVPWSNLSSLSVFFSANYLGLDTGAPSHNWCRPVVWPIVTMAVGYLELGFDYLKPAGHVFGTIRHKSGHLKQSLNSLSTTNKKLCWQCVSAIILRKNSLVLKRLRCIRVGRIRKLQWRLMFPRFHVWSFNSSTCMFGSGADSNTGFLRQEKIFLAVAWWGCLSNGLFPGFICPFSSHFCLVVIVIIFLSQLLLPERHDALIIIALLDRISFCGSSQLDDWRNASAFLCPGAGQRRGVGWLKYTPPTRIQEKHATVDFQQGTVKVTLSSIGNVANHRASFTDCVGGFRAGVEQRRGGGGEKRKKSPKKVHRGSTKSK